MKTEEEMWIHRFRPELWKTWIRISMVDADPDPMQVAEMHQKSAENLKQKDLKRFKFKIYFIQ